MIHPNTFVETGSRIGAGCTIGPSTAIARSRVGDGSVVWFSVLEDAKVGRGCEVGPFARLRPGAVLDDGVQIGNFVEVKASRIGKRSKAKHLAYIGNATVGAGVNIGAGTVVVNYDGYGKHPTVIADGARIGSDTMLVAPLKIGKGAVTGAGSVITKDVPAGALGVERADQKNVKGYRKRTDAKHASKGKH